MTEALYNKDMAPWYDELYVKFLRTEKEVLFLDKVFKKHRVKSVLDIACGTGRHSIALKRLGYEVTGIDLSAPMIEYARKKSKEAGLVIPFHKMDMRKIKLKKKFDAVVILFTSFCYMNRNQDIIDSLNSIRKVLKKNGILIIDVHNFWSKMVENRFKKETKDIVKKGSNKMEIHYKNYLDKVHPLVYLSGSFRRFEGKRRLPLVKDKEPRALRIFTPDEFDLLFRLTGFKASEFYGNFDIKAKLSENNKRLIVLAKKHK